jgi:putative solute:sodium symporter small subunit
MHLPFLQEMEPIGGQMSDGMYDVSFFSPKSDAAKANMKVVVIMLIVWAVAVFGFQFLLAATNQPTPEPAHAQFTKAWPVVLSGAASDQDKRELARSLLLVLGKNVALRAADKPVLKNALNVAVHGLGVHDGNLQAAVAAIGLGNDGFDPLLVSILRAFLVPTPSPVLSENDKTALPKIMDLFLIHNRSALTDTPFLGFPFHYWYTAQFLLILFVGLCWLFCYMTDASNRKYNLEQSEPEPASAESSGTK